jgi:hypothetical protein
MHSEEDSVGFWPGYVAAVASLVQALLLLSAVLAMAVFQLGLTIGQQVDAKTALAMTKEMPLDNAAQKAVIHKNEAKTALAMTKKMPSDSAAHKAVMPKDDAEAPLKVTFSDSVWQLSASEVTQVTAVVRQLQQQEVPRWRMWLPTQTDDPRKRRLGFLRVMAVRNVLLAIGVSAEKIDVQLVQVAESDGVGRRSADEQTVYVSPAMDASKEAR